ncbi:MAG: hypothetical protein Ta2G_18960 [Termitinemataceae bacterium]|nr:MAG: hypothetical protein Ta2G_18960 [Termitinemataceae bacterium]
MSGKELVKKLMRDGWLLERVNGSHHIMRKDNRSIVVPVHANKDLKLGILNQLLKETGYK